MLIENRRVQPIVPDSDGKTDWASDDCVPPGWIPADIGHATIRWIWVGSGEPTEPLFDSWMASERGRVPVPREHETEFEALTQNVAHLRDVAPAGVIFHVSRCGSTLLSNIVSAAEGVFVVSESPAFERMIRVAARPESFASEAGARALADLSKAFGYYRGSPAQQLVLKTGLSTAVAWAAVRRVWPEVPCVMLVRDPAEVVISNVQGPSRTLLEWYNNPAACSAGTVPTEVIGRGLDVFCAWLIGRVCSAALEHMDERCLLLDYRDLTAETAIRIAEFFSLGLADDRRNDIDRIFLYDSKRGYEFEPDTDRKKRAATESITESVARWALDPYQLLLKSERRLRTQ